MKPRCAVFGVAFCVLTAWMASQPVHSAEVRSPRVANRSSASTNIMGYVNTRAGWRLHVCTGLVSPILQLDRASPRFDLSSFIWRARGGTCVRCRHGLVLLVPRNRPRSATSAASTSGAPASAPTFTMPVDGVKPAPEDLVRDVNNQFRGSGSPPFEPPAPPTAVEPPPVVPVKEPFVTPGIGPRPSS